MKRLHRLGRRLLIGALPLLLAACAQFGQPPFADHPLLGKVWDVAAQRFVDPATVIDRAAEARFVLLGEIHDNAEQHRIQARVLDAMVQRGRRPALVMEQYDLEQQASLNSARQGEASDAVKLKALSDLMRQSWEWALYEPIVHIAVQNKLPLIAANISRDALRQVSRQGFQALGEGEQARLAIDTVWTPERQAQMMEELAGGHCGKMPDHMGEAIAKAQRARDAVMADMLAKAAKSGAVAIVGRNHARLDMGVPLYLANRVPNATVLSVGLVEVDAPTDPAAYAASPLGKLHDYLWFTSRPVRKTNPCDAIPAKPAPSPS
jgi:uncharacterized iron-regulated protein